jgi:hypothetical protein
MFFKIALGVAVILLPLTAGAATVGDAAHGTRPYDDYEKPQV